MALMLLWRSGVLAETLVKLGEGVEDRSYGSCTVRSYIEPHDSLCYPSEDLFESQISTLLSQYPDAAHLITMHDVAKMRDKIVKTSTLPF